MMPISWLVIFFVSLFLFLFMFVSSMGLFSPLWDFSMSKSNPSGEKSSLW